MAEASLRQPSERTDCVFPDTALDSGSAPPLKLSLPELPPKRAHGTERARTELL
jgi:hypothetical protein